LEPVRGIIYDYNGGILALNIKTDSVYAVSKDIKNKKNIAKQLSQLLKLDTKYLIDRLGREKSFVWIKRKISDEESEALNIAGVDGIFLIGESKRLYPGDSLACHLLGFTDIDNKGLEGLELAYDVFLKGKYGWKNVLRDARQTIVQSYGEGVQPKDGYSLILAIDDVIQNIVENEIEEVVKNSKPKSVSIIALDPKTGGILAMANYPKYNLNDYTRYSSENFKNRCISDTYEPGSVFKVITASAVLEEGACKLEDKFYCEKGSYKIGNRILHDFRPYETLTFREVIEHSSNIGVVKAASKLGKHKFYDYLKKFGLGAKTGIDLKGEENGILRPVSAWTKSDMTTIPMGQGISCTPIQLACAVSVIANGGILMKPYVVKSIIDKNNNVIKEAQPDEVRRVISEETALRMKDVLRGVVERGTGRRAKLAEYTACGKTGTAQKVGENGEYAKNKYMASFIGFAPYSDPRVALVVCINEPKGVHFGGMIAAPAFKNAMEKILKYIEVPKEDIL